MCAGTFSMMLDNSWRTKLLLGNERQWRWITLLSVLVVFLFLIEPNALAQVSAKKDVLILNEVGLSHALTNEVTQQIVTGVEQMTGRQVELYSENLDFISLPNNPSLTETRDWLTKKYGGHQTDVVVAVGPDTIKFLSDYSDVLFRDVPIVICGTTEGQAGYPKLDSRFTGTWQTLEPGKTLDAAIRIFPNTRHVFVVGGSSDFDRVVMAVTKESFNSISTKVEFSYLNDMVMEKLLEKLRSLPENSIVLYVSFFQDFAGKKFLNATQALPLVASAASAPVFGMSDTYLGHGIVGGEVMNYQEQGKVTARIVSELLEGKKAADIPMENLSGMLMFDWNELKHWHVPETRLPYGSRIVFHEPGFWERSKWIWGSSLLIILGLFALAAYLHLSRKQLRLVTEGHRQLSGMLIHAEEQERHRIASELHDDFSQRLAVLALGLENLDEGIPASSIDIHQQLRKLLNSTTELGSDLHTLSRQLYSSTLESLGLVPAVGALCKEFAAQHNIAVDFISNEISRPVPPDAALCVFRVVQEGLRNLNRHSGAVEAWVELRKSGNRLIVTVRDEGCGFSLKGPHQHEGIGLRSMEERVRSVGGEFQIYSSPGKGTEIRAWVPFLSA